MKIKTLLLTIILFLSMTCIVSGEQTAKELKFGVMPFKGPKGIVEAYFPVATWLSKKLGINVRVVSANSIDQFMQRIYSKQYDIIVLGSTFYFKANEKADYQVLVRGYPPFRSAIIVLKDSGIESLEQLRGKSMAAIHSQGRGGFKLQKIALADVGINADTDIEINFRGNFESVIYSVLSGRDTAGAIRLDSMVTPDIKKLRNKLKVLYTSPDNPQHPFAVHPDMDPILKEKIRTALLEMNIKTPESSALLTHLHIKGIENLSIHDMEMLQLTRKKAKEARKNGLE
jgi:phosphonate transport system substrate-binding protein